MTNPTNPFNWQMPTASDLVTDLPADFETFGQAVATSMADLLGGTTGQILSKASNTDMDFTWITNDIGDITAVTASSPLTGGGTSGAITVGIQDGTTAQKGAVQLENSTSSTSTTTAAVPASVKSAYDLADAAIAKSTVTTAGDIIFRNATVPTRLGIGTAGQVLKVNSGATAPEWGSASSSFVGCQAIADNFSVSYTQYANLAIPFASTDKFDSNGFHDPATNNTRITIPTGYSGKYLITFTGFLGAQNTYANAQPYINGAAYKDYYSFQFYTSFSGTANGRFAGNVLMNLNAGDYVEVYYSSDKTTGTISGAYATFGCVFLGA